MAVYIHKEKKPKIFPANIFGYDIFFSNEYFCLLSLCCTSTFVLWLWFFFQNYLNCLHAILFLKWTLYKSKLFVSWLSWIFIVFCRLYKICTSQNALHYIYKFLCLPKIFLVYVCINRVIIEVNHLLTEFKLACLWTNKLSSMIFMIFRFNNFHAFVLFQ